MTTKRKLTKSAHMVVVAPFDAAEFLDSADAIAEYLDAALRETNPDVFLRALAAVTRAKGMATIAEKAGVGRESLYKTLAPGSSPRHETICRLLKAMDVRLSVTA